jgi:RimJ/RimL family protein N-acetyltransferase
MGIDTFGPKHRNRRFATQVAKAYLKHCVANGLTPLWTADEVDNLSRAFAKKLGFKKVGEYPDGYLVFR